MANYMTLTPTAWNANTWRASTQPYKDGAQPMNAAVQPSVGAAVNNNPAAWDTSRNGQMGAAVMPTNNGYQTRDLPRLSTDVQPASMFNTTGDGGTAGLRPRLPNPLTNNLATPPGGWSYNVPGTNPGYEPGQQAAGQPLVNAPGPGDQDAWNWYRDNGAALSSLINYGTYAQNSYQYANDFNEAQRRWDAEMQWQQMQDQYNMGLAGRQQQMAEWQANEAARQWQQQFGYTQQRDAQEFQLANDQLAVERAYRQGLISNEQRNLALQELTQRQNYDIQNQQTAVDRAYRQGLISNEQRNLALQELTQSQNNAVAQGQLQLSRDELAALQQWRNTDAGLRQQEIDAGTLQARYAAFGRAQAPGQGKFLRNW